MNAMPSTLYNEFPQFDGVPSSTLCRLILEARLSPTDVQIAASRLVWGMDYSDIAAAVGRDRSGVSARLRDVIVPRIERIMFPSDKEGLKRGAG